MKIKRFFAIALIAVLTAMTISFGAMAAAKQTVVVTPTNERGFAAYAESGGTVSFVIDSQAPGGTGALRLTTDGTNESLAQYTRETKTPLASVRELSYYTKQNSGPENAAANFALGVDLDGTANGTDTGFTFLIYEPYLQEQPIIPGVFQFQDVDQGRIYSTSTVACSNGTIQGAPGGFGQFYTLAEVNQICPEAVVTLFGVFIGSYNPNYDVEVDLLNFNGTTYDFEPNATGSTNPVTKEDCKNGGYTRFTNPTFKNQGQCIQFLNNRARNRISRN